MGASIRASRLRLQESSSATNVAVGIPGEAQAGDIILVFGFTWIGSVSMTQAGGPSLTALGAETVDSNTRSRVWWRQLSSGDLGQTITLSTGGGSGRRGVLVVVVQGADPAKVVGVARNMGGSGNRPETSLETIAWDGLALGFLGKGDAWGGTTQTWTSPSHAMVASGATQGNASGNVALAVLQASLSSGDSSQFAAQTPEWTSDLVGWHVRVGSAAAQGSNLTAASTTVSSNGGRQVWAKPAVSGASGTVSRGQWAQVSGPTAAAVSTGGDGSITVQLGLGGGAAVFEQDVTDTGGGSATARLTVNVAGKVKWTMAASPVAAGRTASNGASDARQVVDELWDTAGTALAGTAAQDYVSASSLPESAKTTGIDVNWHGEHAGDVKITLIDKGGATIGVRTVGAAGQSAFFRTASFSGSEVGNMSSLAAGWRIREELI